MKTSTKPNLIGTVEAAKLLGISPVRVQVLTRSGRITSYRIGGILVFDRSEIERFRKIPRAPGRPKSVSA